MLRRITLRLHLTSHIPTEFLSPFAMDSSANSRSQAAGGGGATTTAATASGVPTSTTTTTTTTTEAAFQTILETIDPATITYSSSDLEDPTPEFSQTHTRLILEDAAKVLQSGQVVGMPTETVYGLAANALDSIAAQRIFKAKNRPQDNPLIVHVASLKMLRSILKDDQIPPVYSELIQKYWPGPLTLLFPRSNLIPNEITCGQATVAVRFPSHPITRALIWACGLPLAAPSANSSGKPSPTLASHVMDDLYGKIPMMIDGGQCRFGIESTVVDGLRIPPAILRPGGVTFEQIRQMSGMENVQVYKKHFTDAVMEQAPTTPGMKYRHYSPEAEVVLVEYIRQEDTTITTTSATTTHVKESGFAGSISTSSSTSISLASPSLSPSSPSSSSSSSSTSPSASTSKQYNIILSEIEKLKLEGKKRFGILRTSFTSSSPTETTTTWSGSNNNNSSNGTLTSDDSCVIEFPLGQGSKPGDVARELFKGLRYLDGQNVDCIFVEGISEEDEGLAVMNRVRKAASRTISLETTTFL